MVKASHERALRELGDEEHLPSDLVAGWIHGTLTDAERARVERAAPERLEEALREALAAPSGSAPHKRERKVRARRAGTAAKAALVLACVALLLVRPDPPAAAGEAGRALRSGDFRRAATLSFGPGAAAWPTPATRSAGGELELRVLEPSGISFDARPRIVWTHSASGGPYAVRLVDESWRELARFEVPASPASWPAALPAPVPGSRYLIEVRDLARPASVAKQVVRIADGERRAALERALGDLEPTGDPALDRFQRAWCRARGRDVVGAAFELAALASILGEDALEPLLTFVGDPLLTARVEHAASLAASPSQRGARQR